MSSFGHYWYKVRFTVDGSTSKDFPAITKLLINRSWNFIWKIFEIKMANEENSEETLEALFSRGLDIHSEIESSSEDTNSKEFQLKVRKAILLLEDATR